MIHLYETNYDPYIHFATSKYKHLQFFISKLYVLVLMAEKK